MNSVIKEGQFFDINDRGGALIVKWSRPTTKEIDAFSSGHTIKIGLTIVRNHIFLLFKFGDLPWFETTYSPHLTTWTGLLQKANPGEGYGVTVKLCDPFGTVYKRKLISFTTEFSNALREKIKEQMSLSFNHKDYLAELEEIYSEYSTEDLAKMSTITMRIN